jgi:hypothetical protein
VETSECRVQPRLDLDTQQLPLLSLKSLQLDARVLVIILKAEAMFIGGHQVVFEGCFQIINKCQMVSRLSDEVGHRLWLQGPLKHLGGEPRVSYIAVILRKILEFLYV